MDLSPCTSSQKCLPHWVLDQRGTSPGDKRAGSNKYSNRSLMTSLYTVYWSHEFDQNV